MLVLAMEFSRGRAQPSQVLPTAGRRTRVVDGQESRRLRGSSDNVAPSKRNSEVRRSRRPGYGAGLAAPSRGTGKTDCRRECASAE